LHGAEDTLCGDAGYAGIPKREELRGRELNWKIAARPGKRKKMVKSTQELPNEKEKSSTRAKVKHPFYWVKCFFKYGNVRYQGLDKNSSRLHILLGFTNLIRSKKNYLLHAKNLKNKD